MTARCKQDKNVSANEIALMAIAEKPMPRMGTADKNNGKSSRPSVGA